MLMTNNDGDDEDRNEPRESGPKEWEWKWVHRSARFLGTRRSVACLLNETNQPTNPFHSIPSSQSSSHLPAQDPVPCKKPLEHWSASAVDVTDQRTVKRADGQIRLLRSSVVFNFFVSICTFPQRLFALLFLSADELCEEVPADPQVHRFFDSVVFSLRGRSDRGA